METAKNAALIAMALAVIALCGILAAVTLSLYPTLNRSAENLEQVSQSAVAVTENLEAVSGELTTAASHLAGVARGIADVYETLDTATQTLATVLEVLLGGVGRLGGLLGGGN